VGLVALRSDHKAACQFRRRFALTVTSTSQEGASGTERLDRCQPQRGGQSSSGRATLSVGSASGNEDNAIALTIASSPTDTDGSEHLSHLVVSAIPAAPS